MSIEDDQSEVIELFEAATSELSIEVRTKFEADMDEWCEAIDDYLESDLLLDMLLCMAENILAAVKDKKVYEEQIPWFMQ